MANSDPRLSCWPPAGTQTRGALILQFEIGALRNLVYLIADPVTRKAAWVDPQRDLTLPLEALVRHGLQLESILLTHTHHDHVAGVAPLLERQPSLQVYVHPRDSFRLEASLPFRFIEDQEIIPVGSLPIRAWSMPGHSAGALSFEVQPPGGGPPLLLTGDTLFIRDCGRTDLPTGSTQQMFQSLQRYRQFPAETIILPGHHYQREWWSTLAQEWAESPPFQCRSVPELEALP
jgi:hydroxyacylglutathione hydrolase